jgi:hypothetical protein
LGFFQRYELPDAITTDRSNYLREQLTDRRDLKNVCEVSQYLYSAAAPILYQSVVITADDDLIYPIDIGILCANRRGRILHYTRDIQISCPFRRNLSKRCLDRRRGYDYSEDDELADDAVYGDGLDTGELQNKNVWIDDDDDYPTDMDDFRRLKNNVVSVLIRCKEGGLRKFRSVEVLLIAKV